MGRSGEIWGVRVDEVACGVDGDGTAGGEAEAEGREDVVELEGWLSVGSTGQQVVHPAAKLLQDIETKLVPLEDRLGLNPESRLRLGISSVESQSKLATFLQQKEDN